MQKCISSGINLGWICPNEREGKKSEFPKLLYSELCFFCLLHLLFSPVSIFLVGLTGGWSSLFTCRNSWWPFCLLFPGGPLCGFLCAALYPAQVSGGTKLYLLSWAVLDSSDLFVSVPMFCSEQLTLTVLPLGMLFMIKQVFGLLM